MTIGRQFRDGTSSRPCSALGDADGARAIGSALIWVNASDSSCGRTSDAVVSRAARARAKQSVRGPNPSPEGTPPNDSAHRSDRDLPMPGRGEGRGQGVPSAAYRTAACDTHAGYLRGRTSSAELAAMKGPTNPPPTNTRAHRGDLFNAEVPQQRPSRAPHRRRAAARIACRKPAFRTYGASPAVASCEQPRLWIHFALWTVRYEARKLRRAAAGRAAVRFIVMADPALPCAGHDEGGVSASLDSLYERLWDRVRARLSPASRESGPHCPNAFAA